MELFSSPLIIFFWFVFPATILIALWKFGHEPTDPGHWREPLYLRIGHNIDRLGKKST